LRKWYDDILGLAGAGAVALLLALPFLRVLTGSGESHGAGEAGASFATISVRQFPFGIQAIADILHRDPQRLQFLASPLLPVNYFLELGFFLVVAVLRVRALWRRRIPMTRSEGTAWLGVLASFLVGTFLHSTTLGSNDLGWRCFLLAQLIFLLWGVFLVEEWWVGVRPDYSRVWLRFAQICMVLGIIGSVYQATMLRIYPILHDNPKEDPLLFDWVYGDQKVGERTYALRSVYERLNKELPPDAIVQYNPYAASFISHEIYSGHGATIGGPNCVSVFGGDLNQCGPRIDAVVPLFWHPNAALSARVDEVCREFGIRVMLVDDTDKVWNSPESWVWTRTPLIANDYVRAFACGNSVQQAGLKPAP
jgi:hypothetical protein